MPLRTYLKQLGQVFVPRTMGSWMMSLPRTDYNYAREVGTGANSSVVMGVVNWIARAFPEAPMVVYQHDDEEPEIVANHPLAQRIRTPNEFYSGERLWMATTWSWCLFGNAYWRLVRDRGRRVREIWWVPPWHIEPQWPQDGSQFVTHYLYQPDGKKIDLPLDQVVHFRHGIDPYNPRLGLSPLQAVVREIWSDDEASNWVASLLRNMGVPGMIMTPDGDVSVSEAEVEAVKAYVASRFTGDHRGEPMALGSPIKVQKLSFSPSEMDLSVVRDTSEERVSAMLGIPAAVVGFGTGLQQTKVGATMEELRKLAWQNGIVPVQRIMAGEVGRVLLPAYESDPDGFEVGWDYRRVQALQEDESVKASRYDVMVRGGWVMRSEARRAMGLETTAEDDVYHLPINIVESGPGAPKPLALPVNRRPQLSLVAGGGDEEETDEEDADPDDEKRLKAYLKQGTLEEWITGLIRRHAPQLDKPPQVLSRLFARMEREQKALQPRLSMLLAEGLMRIGTATASIAQAVMRPKQDLTDYIVVSRILDQLPLLKLEADLAQLYDQLFTIVAESTVRAVGEALRLDTTVSPQLQQALVVTSQDRVRLLKLKKQIETSLLTVLEEARADGLQEDERAKLIEERIPAGRNRTVQTRARTIARTESRFAANLATLEHSRQHGIGHVLVFDARLGNTDETCELRNGLVVTVAEAGIMAQSEHINGTYGVAPVSPALMQEMGVAV